MHELSLAPFLFATSVIMWALKSAVAHRAACLSGATPRRPSLAVIAYGTVKVAEPSEVERFIRMSLHELDRNPFRIAPINVDDPQVRAHINHLLTIRNKLHFLNCRRCIGMMRDVEIALFLHRGPCNKANTHTSAEPPKLLL